jgi:N-methylhydantoinase B
MRTDRVRFAPYGLSGGASGGKSRNFMEVGNERTALPGKITTRIGKGTLIIHEQAGAGGFGDPLARDPKRVIEDVLDGKITPAYATDQHAVVLSPSGQLDMAETARLRTSRARLRDGGSHGG